MRESINKLAIGAYMHCGKCMEELPEGVTPQEYRSLDIGWTNLGIQVWCIRHDCNVIHIDSEGHHHHADQSIYERPKLELV